MRTPALTFACFVALLGFFSFAMPLAVALPETGEVRIHEVRGNPAEIIMPDGSKPVLRVNDAIPQGAVLKTEEFFFVPPFCQWLTARHEAAHGTSCGQLHKLRAD